MCDEFYDSDTNESQQIQAAQSVVDRIATSGIGPQSVSGDAGSVTNYPIRDMIAAANYLYGLAAARTPRRGVMFSRLIPDATVQGPRRRGFRGPWLGSDWNGYSWP
jgi:hypothetical protein